VPYHSEEFYGQPAGIRTDERLPWAVFVSACTESLDSFVPLDQTGLDPAPRMYRHVHRGGDVLLISVVSKRCSLARPRGGP
jgi:hypothetical protein